METHKHDLTITTERVWVFLYHSLRSECWLSQPQVSIYYRRLHELKFSHSRMTLCYLNTGVGGFLNTNVGGWGKRIVWSLPQRQMIASAILTKGLLENESRPSQDYYLRDAGRGLARSIMYTYNISTWISHPSLGRVMLVLDAIAV